MKMKTTAEYRAMAEECLQWAGEANENEVRALAATGPGLA